MIKPIQRWALLTAAGLAVTATAAIAANGNGLPAGQDTAVISGGASIDDFADLNRQAGDYQLKLILAAKRSGAYLADVDVVVRSLPSREVVLEHRSQGPLVLAQLAPGRYEVTASYGDVLPGAATRNVRTFTVPASRNLAQMVMYFDTGDEVNPNSPPQYSTPPQLPGAPAAR